MKSKLFSAGVETATLSTANCASWYTGTNCNKQG